MQKRLIYLVPFVIIVSAALAFGGVSAFKKYNEPKRVHYHAGFQVYLDGKLQDFSGNKYMHEAPCTVNGKPVEGDHDEQLEKAHLHDHEGNVVHVHRENALWGDLFKNIKYQFPDAKTIQAFVNGKEVADIHNYQIKPNDSILIVVGEQENTDELLKTTVTKDAILEVGKKSETCGS